MTDRTSRRSFVRVLPAASAAAFPAAASATAESCYWDAYSRETVERYIESKTAPGHAAEFETSFALAAFPEHVHWEGVDYAEAKPHLVEKDEADE